MDLLDQLEPDRPLTPFAVDRAAVEAWLGVRLPAEYWELTRFGTVVIGGAIVLSAADREYLGMLPWAKSGLRADLREAGLPPLRLHPVPGGLLPWGHTVNGRTSLLWNTADPEPDSWTVVLCDPTRSEPPLDSGLTLTAFLETVILDRVGRLGPLPATVAPHWNPPVAGIPSPRPELTAAEREFALHGPAGPAALRLLVPPPPAVGCDWDRVFDRLGTRLPSDYRELMDAYGGGCWSHWLWLAPPGGLAGLPELIGRSRPGPCRPEPDGFLVIGSSIDSDRIGWLTVGPDPDAWPVAIRPRHIREEVRLSGGLVEVLVGWLRGGLDVPGLPGLDPDDDPFECAGFEPLIETPRLV
ncbi:SMI1/KNR4 family protein [Kitasatospora sp. CB01950]|uniref:SMI1/KNR4 family protein n=1 Tax=Kitasatospora sp. CB01950 TaxID=1703930 RepID=UPI0009398F36|nr:SMI1/KNR4 family protein [Kitasatospora sp. CB01950]OKJ17086.1 hypothetical protein AMK19_02950 [Kitasatospora sp. CB01950]